MIMTNRQGKTEKNRCSKPVTVLQIRNSVAYGGVETTMLGWLDNINKEKFSCPVALFLNKADSQEAFAGPLRKHGHEILDIPWAPGRNVRAAVRRLVEIVRDRDVKLIHCHDWRSDFIGLLVARKTGLPVMTTIYVWFRRPWLTWVKEKIDSYVIRKFDLVTAVCNATREQTVEMGVRRDRTDVLISGISPDLDPQDVDVKAVRERFGFTMDQTCFVYAARFYLEKAHDTLIKAFAAARKYRHGLKLLLLGTGPLEDDIRHLARQLGVSDHVVMPGFVEDVPAILKSMDVMVHASLAEGIALAIYEGMITGLPVIGSDVDGTPEVVIPGRTGWLVPVRDEEALAKAIGDAADNPELRRKYGIQAKELIMNNYSISRAVSKLEATYSSLIQRSTES